MIARESLVNERFSFAKGWNQVQNKDLGNCRKDLMDAIGITSLQAFRERSKGKYEPTVTEAAAIEGVFAKYGITDVWGY